ncbi:hypothetical protein Ga0074812_1575 [Parafrankia irregularis]|uniref:Uncharacterized protein n=1 Tax=Parafrankia irregularis TaxID=795642 RepID=A0A0S4QZP5_9ACTN|nr:MULTISPECIES: hypothetical protein [Parafrankia]MBE3206802.1 hypothetical protein [Parafrankia sp. CH37]MBE3206827.1 hypothetical protein [Parafrankia sp. CH37]CUU61115.1 hypothetical protein Ga0074812_1575 [Parafrankia irregularis]
MKHARLNRRFRRWPLVLTVALVAFVVYAARQPTQAAATVTTVARAGVDVAQGLAAFIDAL